MSRGGRRRGNNRLDKAYRAQGATGNVQARLRILATTDLHMHILPYDYFTDKVSHTRGLARTASLIHAARAEVGAENCLLVDNGDFLTGTPMDDEIARRMEAPPETAQTSPHPMISVMNGLGYDAATLGNHDFDHGGVARLEQILEQASFPPFVLANVNRPGGDSTSFLPPPHKILTRQVPDQDGTFHPLRIGITGLLPPQSIRPRRTLKTLPRTEDMVSAAQRVVPALRAQGGADIVLLLAHTGIGEADHHPPGLENALVPLSRVAGGWTPSSAGMRIRSSRAGSRHRRRRVCRRRAAISMTCLWPYRGVLGGLTSGGGDRPGLDPGGRALVRQLRQGRTARCLCP